MIRFLKHRRRGAIGLEAVMTLPVVLLVGGLVAQSLLIAQNRIYVEQAAYAAARSALVHKCPDFEVGKAISSPYGAVLNLTCNDDPNVWLDAARWALIPASPSSFFAKSRGKCSPVVAGTRVMTAGDWTKGLEEAVENRICYSFEDGNVDVDVEWVSTGLYGLANTEARPIRATVKFKSALTTPIQRMLSDGVHSDGTPWIWVEATVVLL